MNIISTMFFALGAFAFVVAAIASFVPGADHTSPLTGACAMFLAAIYFKKN